MQSIGRFSIGLPLAIAIYLSGCQTPDTNQATSEPAPTSAIPTGAASTTEGATFIVDSIDDSGPGTLRNAILKANASPGRERIIFQSSAGLFKKPQVIQLSTSLPTITDDIIIDGFIDDMLWKASGITLDGMQKHQILKIANSVNAKISNLTFTQGASQSGGAIKNSGTLIISGVLFTENQATSNGGAIFNDGTLYLINSTIHKNHANGSGGGVYHKGNYLKITHATFDQNDAPSGGGIYSSGQAVIQNSIVANSVSDFDCFAEVAFSPESESNIIEKSKECGSVLTSEDPDLGKLGAYNGPTRSIPINTRSAAFNWANNSASVDENGDPLVWDQRGNGDPRFALGIADIGAFEAQPQVRFEVDTLTDSDVRGCTPAKSDCSLRGALRLLNSGDRHNHLGFDPELFKAGGNIKIERELPEVIRNLTLDASNVGKVVLTGASKLRAAKGVKIKMLNIETR